MITPRLKTGQKIAFMNVSDSPAIISSARIEAGISRMNKLGFEVEFNEESLFKRVSSREQADEFNNVVQREEVGCILCASGGTRCVSLLPYIDFDVFAKNPKLVMGTSDCSHLLQAIAYKTNIVTIEGPVVNRLCEWSLDGEKAFMDYCIRGMDMVYEQPAEWNVFSEGTAHGIAWSGNPITIASMQFLLNRTILDDAILCIEDHSHTSEEMIRYWFSVLREKGTFQSLKGMIFGAFTATSANTLHNIYIDFFQDLNIPVVQTDVFGTKHYCPIPLGTKCTIDTTQKIITFHHA